MMLIEEQRREPIKVSCSPKPLDTTTQESSYSEELKQSIYRLWLLTLKGKKIDGNDLFNLLSKVLEMHCVNFAQIVEWQGRYKEIIQEEDMGVARGNAMTFIGDLRVLGADDRVCNIFSKQFELHFRLSKCYNDAATGKPLEIYDIMSVLDTILNVSDEDVNMYCQRYQRILQEKNMEVARENTFKFVDKLLNLGADDRVCNIILKQHGFHFLLSEYYNVTKTGKLLEEDDLKVVLSTILRVSDEEVNMYYSRYQRILQEEDMGVARGNAVKFIGDLRVLGADEKVCTIFLKQFGLHFLFKECDNVINTGKCLKDDDVKLLFNMIPEISAEKSDEIYQCYQRVLQEENMEVARENAFKFIDKLSSLGADERVLRIILKQIGLNFLLNEFYNATNTGKCLKDDDIKAVLNMIPRVSDNADECLKDDPVKIILNKMPRISDEKGDELYRRYQVVVRRRNNLEMEVSARNFIDYLSKLEADEKVIAIIFNQFGYYFDFLAEYYNNEQVADTASIRKLLNKIPGVSSEAIDKLCKEYENIINEKDRNGAVHFIYELSSMGVEESICDIIQIEFCKAEIILPAEVRPSISGNLFVPEDAKFKKRYEYGGKFIRVSGLFDEEEEYENPANRPLAEELVEYFREEVIKPFEECQRCLPTYIEQQLKDEKPSTKPKEKLREMLDILISGEIDEAFKKSLKVVEGVTKTLVSEGNRANDRRLKKPASYSPGAISGRKVFGALKAVLPDEKKLMLISECIAMLDKINGRKPLGKGLRKRAILAKTPFYDTDIVRSAGGLRGFMFKLERLARVLTSSKETLFPHDPCLNDIRQGYIGDCYLLASIISLLNSQGGPDFIRNMMIDNGDGTVTVRLNAQNQREFDEGKSHVVYVKVYRNGLISNPYAALWVQIIEKAYISLGANLYLERKKGKLEGIKVDYKNKDDRKKYARTVEDLHGGYGENAFMVLAGIKCDVFHKSDFGEENFEKKFKEAISKKLPVTCSFKSEFSYDVHNFIDRHAYSIVGIEEKDGETIVKLANPNNVGKDMFCSFKELKEHMRRCVIANTDSKTEGMGS